MASLWKEVVDQFAGGLSGVHAVFIMFILIWVEAWQNKQNHMGAHQSETQSSLGIRPVWSVFLIRVFAVRLKKPWVLRYPLSAKRKLWSDSADLSLRWAHFVGFVLGQLLWPMIVWFLGLLQEGFVLFFSCFCWLNLVHICIHYHILICFHGYKTMILYLL